MEGGYRFGSLEDSVNELLNFDAYAGWCNSPDATDNPYAMSPFNSSNLSFEGFSFGIPVTGGFTQSEGPILGNCSYVPDMVLQGLESQFAANMDSGDGIDQVAKRDGAYTEQNYALDYGNIVIPRLPPATLAEKMLKALSLFKESAEGGILAQVWVPLKNGEQYILSTCDQPYLLDQVLAGYREVSRSFTFAAEVKPGSFLGLPGRVFASRVPEWTSSVLYYNNKEYIRVQHARHHEVRGSIALPVFSGNSLDASCCAVLELVTTAEKTNFDTEMKTICRALEAVNLRSVEPPRLHNLCMSKNQRSALTEIRDVLRAVCHAHSLPVALTWIPCSYAEGAGEEVIKVRVRGGAIVSNEKCVLCVEDTTCYVNDKNMNGFVHACMEHYLEEGQGIVGKAFQSNRPFFFSDVKEYHVSDYPLVHHARKYLLSAAVAIRLRSTYTGHDDYILELFLPVSLTGSVEQQHLLNNLSSTMQRICKSLRTVSDAEISKGDHSKSEAPSGSVSSLPPFVLSMNVPPPVLLKGDFSSASQVPSQGSNPETAKIKDTACRKKSVDGPKRQSEKKRSTSEKHVSLSVLQQYFSGSLKDTAKIIGVCPTTLKRICRKHGISRWPSRKINKVTRSLNKIRSMLGSVEGVEGGLKFDPATGDLVATAPVNRDHSTQENIIFSGKEAFVENTVSAMGTVGSDDPTYCMNRNSNIMKVEEGYGDEKSGKTKLLNLNFCKENNVSKMSQIDSSSTSKSAALDCSTSKFAALDSGPAWPSSLTVPWPCPANEYPMPCIEKGKGKELYQSDVLQKFHISDSHFTSQSSGSIAALDVEDEQMKDRNRLDGDRKSIEQNLPAYSGGTEISSGSGSTVNGSATSSRCFAEQADLKPLASFKDSGYKLTVKATYKDDTIRFKFDTSSGCFHLYEEIAKRFKLEYGTFQLKYMDDEEEWVLLTNDADLQECLEILDLLGTRSVKFLVRDSPCGIGSSESSNCFLVGDS